MAPVHSALWGLGVAGSGVTTTLSLGNDQLVVVGTLTAISAFVLLSLLLLLCTSCQGQKKSNIHPGDQENLMNGVSEKETVTESQSVDSPVTDPAVSSSHNGPLTSGTVLTDTQENSPQPSEDMLSSQSELRCSKCPQDRELPSIPPNSALDGVGASNGLPHPLSGDGTYEVVKDSGGVMASRDVSVEDSLYETVKELKDQAGRLTLPNGYGTTSPLSPDDNQHLNHLDCVPPILHNGSLSPCTSERGPLCAGVEYASVDLNKKSRYSADMESRRSASIAAAVSPAEEPEEDRPPPVPEKVLDENDNHPSVMDGEGPVMMEQFHSPMTPSPGLDDHVLSEIELSDLYSTVERSNLDEKESDYSSIAEFKGLVPESSSSDLYATVRDIYPQPGVGDTQVPAGDLQEPAAESTDPGYETIRIPKPGSGEDLGVGNQVRVESDYECVEELGLNGENSRL
ncbi:hypothetical protein UPYG_G00334750 [Umbra pygmaea]|uniref:Phosphoprotein membrane anchor with glycosphingolipid microdomains 1 n=1 Tax=Umbra pygmaea TaxID=75934 RepID=A0ABD0WCV2_UMBPY